jgi:hypothetical protein
MEIEVMVWPMRWPDLNPIENLGALWKAELHNIRPDLMHQRNNNEPRRILVKMRKSYVKYQYEALKTPFWNYAW